MIYLLLGEGPTDGYNDTAIKAEANSSVHITR